jgi:hypothetical protein
MFPLEKRKYTPLSLRTTTPPHTEREREREREREDGAGLLMEKCA